jgi:hypothetical protein
VPRGELGDVALLAVLAEEGRCDVGRQLGAKQNLAGVGEADPAAIEETVDMYGQQDAVVGV